MRGKIIGLTVCGLLLSSVFMFGEITQKKLDGFEAGTLLLSPGGKHLLVIYGVQKKRYIYADGDILGPYESVKEPVFSWDGSRYIIPFQNDKQSYLLTDGKENGPYTSPVLFYFSRDTKKIGFTYLKDNLRYVHIGSQELGPFGDLGLFIPVSGYFSPSGNRYAFILSHRNWYHTVIIDDHYYRLQGQVMEGPYFTADDSLYMYTFIKDNKTYLNRNGKIYGPFEEAGQLLTSFQDKYLWFSGKKNGKSYFFINDRIFGPCATAKDISFSFDDSLMAFVYDPTGMGKYLIQIDNTNYGPFNGYPTSDYINIRFSPDSSRYACTIREDKDIYIFDTGRKIGPFEEAYFTEYSPKNSVSGYWYKKNGAYTVVVGNNKHPSPGEIVGGPYLSDEGTSYAFISRIDNKSYLSLSLNGKTNQSGPFDFISGRVLFSPDGNRYGFHFARDGVMHAVIDGKEYGPFGFASGLEFTPDSRSYAMMYSTDNGYWFLINDTVRGPFDRAEFAVTEDNRIVLAYLKDGTVYREIVK